MSAFESSPVHCLKFLPSEKRRSPAKDGASAMLQFDSTIITIATIYSSRLTAYQCHQLSSVLPIMNIWL